MLKVGWMRESYVYCRGPVSYRSRVQHLPILNPQPMAMSILSQRLEKKMMAVKLNMFRIGEMELKDVAAGDENSNVFKPLPQMTASIGANELQAPGWPFWINQPLQFLRWGYKISETSLNELFCCNMRAISSCSLLGSFMQPDIISNVLAELIILYNRARREGLDFIAAPLGHVMQLGSTINESPIGRFS